MFTQAVRLELEPMALMLTQQFESVMSRSPDSALPAILNSLRKPNATLNEVKLFILQRLKPSLRFKHADELLQLLEEQMGNALQADGFVVNNTNPLMVIVLMTDILYNMKV